jgi:hypothetical protein
VRRDGELVSRGPTRSKIREIGKQKKGRDVAQPMKNRSAVLRVQRERVLGQERRVCVKEFL